MVIMGPNLKVLTKKLVNQWQFKLGDWVGEEMAGGGGGRVKRVKKLHQIYMTLFINVLLVQPKNTLTSSLRIG
jgi:hypothetical protein